MSREMVFFLLAVNEFLHGCAVSLLTAMTAKNIFGRKIKKYLLFSVIGGFLFSAAVTSCVWYYRSVNAGVFYDVFYVLLVLFQWLLLTDKSRDSLLTLLAAILFSNSVISAVGNIVFSVKVLLCPADLWAIADVLVYLIQYVLAALFALLLCKILGREKHEMLTLPNMAVLSLSVCLISMFTHESYAMNEEYANVSPAAIIPVSVTLLFIAVSVLLSIKSTQNKYLERMNSLNEEYLDAQARHFESVRRSDTEIRRLNHDMKNHFICMNELYRSGNYTELGDYLENLSRMAEEAQHIVRTGNEIADVIIGEKQLRAEKKGITFFVTGNFQQIEISAVDLCTILANLIDNAVEAAEAETVRDKTVRISCGRTANFIILAVENKTAAAVDVSASIQTTKADTKHHGFGLENVRKAVGKYGGDLDMECTEKDGEYLFKAEVILPGKNS